MIVDFTGCIPSTKGRSVDIYLVGQIPTGEIFSILFDGEVRKGITPYFRGFSSTTSLCVPLHRHTVCKQAEPGNYLIALILMPSGVKRGRGQAIGMDTTTIQLVK